MWYLLGLLFLLASLVTRVAWYPVVTSDYTYFVSVWFNTLATHPWFGAFAQPFADYAPLYLYFLKLLTFIPVSSLYSSKTLSLVFDLLMACAAYLIIQRAPQEYSKDKLFFAFALILTLPTVIINTSLWGQSDAVYAAGILFSLYFMLTDRPLYVALLFGFAISIKVQAIFFLPIFIGYLLKHKEYWWYVIVPPLVFFITILPAWFGGGSLAYWLFIYMHQAGEYAYLSVSAQSIFAFANPLPLSAGAQNVLFWIGIAAALLVAGSITYLVKKVSQPTTLINLSLLSVLLLPYVLPRMHERYFYLADIISVLYAYYNPKRWYVPVVVVLTSLMAYMPFLSSQVSFLAPFHFIDLRVPAAILGVLIIFLVYDFFYLQRSTRDLG